MNATLFVLIALPVDLLFLAILYYSSYRSQEYYQNLDRTIRQLTYDRSSYTTSTWGNNNNNNNNWDQ